MRIKFLCIIICLFVNALVFASATNHTITGVVISGEDNEPLIGASVYVHADDLKKAGVSQTSLPIALVIGDSLIRGVDANHTLTNLLSLRKYRQLRAGRCLIVCRKLVYLIA